MQACMSAVSHACLQSVMHAYSQSCMPAVSQSCMPIVSALGRMRQEDLLYVWFKVSFSSRVKSWFKTTTRYRSYSFPEYIKFIQDRNTKESLHDSKSLKTNEPSPPSQPSKHQNSFSWKMGKPSRAVLILNLISFSI